MNTHPNITFGAGAAESTMSPLGLIAMLLAILCVFVLPRKWVIVAFLVFAFLVPLGQQFTVGGFHFFAHRLVILCGCLRFLLKRLPNKSVLAGGYTTLDKVFLVWATIRALAFILLYREGGAVVNQIGFLWDALGGYFLIRCLIRNVADICRVAKAFAVIALIMAGCMLYEHYKVQNVFALLMGGRIAPNIRNGNIRCRGVFEQEIIASSFGGTLVPLFIWLWIEAKARIVAFLGLASAVVVMITASSSTGISAAAIAVGALCLWPLRRHTRWMRWAFVTLLVALSLVMNAPIWFVLARVDFVGGSTGWDRANLIDQCVRHFSSWWLVGTADNDTWGFFTWDLCNQFVAEAVQGGLATLILFLVLIVRSFQRIGVGRSMTRSKTQEFLLWTVGCIICGHLGSFFGISYFDQMKYWWYVTLAMIPAAAMTVQSTPKRSSRSITGLDRIPIMQFIEPAVMSEKTL